MVYSNFPKSLREIRMIQEATSSKHKEVIKILDSTDLEGLPDFPNKVWLDIYSFEKLTNIANDLYDLDLKKVEKIDRIHEGIQDSKKLKKQIKSLKLQLESISIRMKKDKLFIEKITKRISSVISEYRERCRSSMIDYIKTIDLDIRKILKPLVPTRVVDENIPFPRLNSESMIVESLESTIEKGFQEQDNNELEDDDDTGKLTAHINMLVKNLEKVAKDLLIILHETNRKYYEIVNPSQLFSEAPTPLAMPLPEYFTFENIENHSIGLPKTMLNTNSIANLKNKVERLLRRGSLTTQEAKSMMDKIDDMVMKSSNDLETVLKNMPDSKREDIVFQIIHSTVRGESHCSPRTERKEIDLKIEKGQGVNKKPQTQIISENKRLFKPRGSLPAASRQRKTSLPKATSVNRFKKEVKKDELRAKTPTKTLQNKRSKKSVRTNKTFLI
ncbi:hypothetical protein SteCoe_25494 [Stentor coeruleus]|uniref:Uncharacterized protein n=1 Tax=Stentor coeruleus TaxID=5963 RepID=A0A1R2BF28_9CILI|nr:hypothetical protein SteCoe_25494 [Stentor coeruleus]